MPDILIRTVGFLKKQVLDCICVVLLAAVLIVVTFQVLNRFLLGIPVAWTEEAARYLFVWLSLLGAVRGVRDRAHLQVGLFVQALPLRAQKVLDIIAGAFVLTLLWAVIHSALIILPLTWTRRIATMDVPIFYLYVATPIAAGLMILFLLGNMIQDHLRPRSMSGPQTAETEPFTRG